MQPHSKRLDRVLCLIEGYPSNFGGVEVESSKAAVSQRMSRELNAAPGTWFIVGDRRAGTGARVDSMRARGYEAAEVNAAVYARVPHPSGLPIESVVPKQLPWLHMVDKLPTLTADRFGWSTNELTDALATARAWLFPTEGMQAA